MTNIETTSQSGSTARSTGEWPGDDRSSGEEGQTARTSPSRAIADLGLHLDGTARDEVKIAHAEMIATRFGAHVEGLLTNLLPSSPYVASAGSAVLAAHVWEQGEKSRQEAEARLRTRLDRVDAPTELRRIDSSLQQFAGPIARLARMVDLMVVGRPYGEETHWPEVLETVIFDAAATAYVVPPEAERCSDLRTILVGWRDTPECARAIAAALPFLQRADLVYLVSVAEFTSDEERHREPAADMARHLARHGVTVEIRHLPQWRHPGEALLNEASMIGADLIVFGAYGRTRLREYLLGGVTRDLLTKSPLPMLIAH